MAVASMLTLMQTKIDGSEWFVPVKDPALHGVFDDNGAARSMCHVSQPEVAPGFGCGTGA